MVRILTFFFSSFAVLIVNAQLIVNNTSFTPSQLVQNFLLGSNVSVSNITFNGQPANSVNTQAGYFNGQLSNIGLDSGLIVATGSANVALGPNNSQSASSGSGSPNPDPDLALLSPGAQQYDAGVLEFDFVPLGDSVSFVYVFASEEYDEWVCSIFNDIFGLFLSGPGISGSFSNNAKNLALVPGTNTFVSINTVNLGIPGSTTGGSSQNCLSIDPMWANYNIYYTQNTQNTIQFDGFTIPLTAKAKVICGSTYHVKIAIADVSDPIYDSGIFLSATSFSSNGTTINVVTNTGADTIVEGCGQGASIIFSSNSGSSISVPVIIQGTTTNGTDHTFVNDTLFIPAGTASDTFNIFAFADTLTEGVETLVISFNQLNSCGLNTVTSYTLYVIDSLKMLADLGPDSSLSCFNFPLTIYPTVSGGYSPYSYLWSNGSTNSTLSFNLTGDTTFYLIVNGQCGTSATDSVFFDLAPYLPMQWNGDSLFLFCPNDTTFLNPNYLSGGNGPFTYLWSTGQDTIPIFVNPATSTNYNVTITDICGNDTSVFFGVDVRVPDPLVVTVAQPDSCVLPDQTLFFPVTTFSGNGNYTYSWAEQGDAYVLSQDANGSILVGNPVTATFSLTVTDECRLTQTIYLNLEMCEIIIPNIITANADGKNEIFHIHNLEYYPNSQLWIYNRWGQLIYKSDDYKNDWSGLNVTDGTYYYILRLTYQKERDYTGFLMVIH